MRFKYISCVLLFASIFSFNGCYTNKAIWIDNSEDSNLNYRQDKIPLTVIVYELKNPEKFAEASVRDLVEKEDVVLGRDKVDSLKLQIPPKTQMLLKRVDRKKSPYLGLLAIYALDSKQKSKSLLRIKRMYFLPSKIMFEARADGINPQKKRYKKKDMANGK